MKWKEGNKMRSKTLFLRTIIMAVFVGSGLFLLNGCGRVMMQEIKSENENETLKGQIASLDDPEDLVVGDLNGYDEKIGDGTFFVIEGKVKNQSKFTKKYIKIRFIIFDEDKLKLAEQEAICGRIIGREELKQQPPEFFKGNMIIKPQTEQEMITPPDKAIPFTVIFKNLPVQAKDFMFKIVEAPNL